MQKHFTRDKMSEKELEILFIERSGKVQNFKQKVWLSKMSEGNKN